MSIAYDAKHQALKAYPNKCDDGIELFLTIYGSSRSDMEYNEGQTADEYVYGEVQIVNAK
jgi:hypothetical protein